MAMKPAAPQSEISGIAGSETARSLEPAQEPGPGGPDDAFAGKFAVRERSMQEYEELIYRFR